MINAGTGDPRALDGAQADAAAASTGHGVTDADPRVLTAAPNPVSTPQPISAAEASGIVSGILPAAPRHHAALGERAQPAIWYSGWPSRR